MMVSEIRLQDFRCYKDYRVFLGPGLNIVHGPNATGKTSLLEAVYVLGLTKSNRTSNDDELVRIGTKNYTIHGVLKQEKHTDNIMVSYSNKTKRVKLNNNHCKSLADYIGHFNVVVFSPFDLFLFSGSPSTRRRELDLMLCQLSKVYLVAATSYRRLLKERNALLKECGGKLSEKQKVLISVVTERMLKEGSQLITVRERFFSKLNTLVCTKHNDISGGKEDLVLKYQPSVKLKDYQNMVESSLFDDVKRGNTLYGPHRDDYLFLINNKNTAYYGSQGQRRNAILSVKLAFVDLIYEVKKKYPVVLLDDVFSEFDINRQNQLIKTLDKKVQTIITTATLADIDQRLIKNAKIIKLNTGGEEDE